MPIHYACGGGHLEMVKFLFSQGALIASVAKVSRGINAQGGGGRKSVLNGITVKNK